MIIIRSIVLSICVYPRFCTRASAIKAPNVKKQFSVNADGVSARINFHSDVSNAITDRAVLQELYRPARITRTTNPLITIACARYINQRMIFDAANLSRELQRTVSLSLKDQSLQIFKHHDNI
jgi:hypothetical protein